jgi:hypothetical protein
MATLVCFVTWVLPTQPTLMSRVRGTQLRYPQTADDMHQDPSFNSKLPSQRIYTDFASVYRTNVLDRQSVRYFYLIVTVTQGSQLMEKLWTDVWGKGGVLLRTTERIFCWNVGHLNILSAIIYEGRRSFLIMDPEISNQKYLTFCDLQRLILDDIIQFDFFEFT